MRVVSKTLSLAQKVIDEHLCCSSKLPLLMKLENIQISVLIAEQMRPIRKRKMSDNSKIRVKLSNF